MPYVSRIERQIGSPFGAAPTGEIALEGAWIEVDAVSMWFWHAGVVILIVMA